MGDMNCHFSSQEQDLERTQDDEGTDDMTQQELEVNNKHEQQAAR